MKYKMKKKALFSVSFIVTVIKIFLCFNHYYCYYYYYYYYHFAYPHYDSQYFCFHFYHFLERLNKIFKNSWCIFSVNGSYWLWNRKACQNQGGDLASIETEEEWNFIQRHNTTHNENIWSIGLTKKAGNWTWVSERLLTIWKWGQGEQSLEHDAAFM